MTRDRTWGFWTEQKLAILRDYLPAFNSASAKARGTLYLDLFAGDPENRSRTTGEGIEGSSIIALSSKPGFGKVVLFELPAQADRLDADLRARFPQHDLRVVPGDCNETVGPVLRELAGQGWDWAPSFALVDQYAAEVRWETLQALAEFRRSKRGFRTELWLLFAPSMIRRAAGTSGDFDARVDAMFGTRHWRLIELAREDGTLSADRYREELTNLMRWRLERELGYLRTHAFHMVNTRNVPLYTMIFATCNATGDKIMDDLYRKAARLQPRMQVEAVAKQRAKREAEAGIVSMFDEDLYPVPVASRPGRMYVHLPPVEPWEPER